MRERDWKCCLAYVLADENESSGTASIYISSLKHILIEQISIISTLLEFCALESRRMKYAHALAVSTSVKFTLTLTLLI